MTQKIGISGAKGSFSEEAARTFAGLTDLPLWKPAYLVSVENVLESLKDGSIERGIFPIENSNGGIVIEAVHAMAKHTFTIERLFEIDVHHCLLAVKGVNTGDITTITSHDQALKQCRMYLKRRWSGVELNEYADTAQSACDLGKGSHQTQHVQQGVQFDTCPWCSEGAQSKDVWCDPKGSLPKTTAVIAPKRCAELYDLDVLEESIQDLKFNFTTFVAARP